MSLGLNLHALARPFVTMVNPEVTVIILESAGFAVVDYEQRPAWRPAVAVQAQAQPVADKTLQFLVQQRQNTIWHDFYLPGEWHGLNRAQGKGGDLLYWAGFEWQVDQVLERWPGWCKVRCVQLRAAEPPEIGATEPPQSPEGE